MVTIFAEKFDIALKICVSLSDFYFNGKKISLQELEVNKKAIEKEHKKKGYIEINYKGKTLVTWGQGHLVRLKSVAEYNEDYKKWGNIPMPFIPKEYEIAPIDSPFAKKQLKVIKDVFSKSDLIINATDFDREGDLIFSYIYEYLNCKKEFKRVKIESLTDEGIRKTFSNYIAHEKVINIQNAGKGRSIADWVVGINLTVAKSLKENQLMSIGRVQTPTLNMIVKREHEIKNFKSEIFYVLESEFSNKYNRYKGKVVDKYSSLELLKGDLEKIKGNAIVEKVEKKLSKVNPPNLYNLTSLSMDCNDKYKFSAKNTLEIAQSLYEKGYITYPRTSSIHLTDDMKEGVNEILNLLERTYLPELSFCTSRNFTRRYYDSKKVDSHYAIIPTNNIPQKGKLSENELKVYLLIAKRIAMSVFDPALIEKTYIITKAGDIEFETKGSIIRDKSYLIFADIDAETKDSILPDIKEKELYISNPSFTEGKTAPPNRYNDKTLLQAMKSAGKKADEEDSLTTESGIGTPATRADIIENLISKEYVLRKGKNFIPTDKGFNLIDHLSIEDIKSPSMTAIWENMLNKIERGDETLDNFKRNIHQRVFKWCDDIKNEKVSEKSEETEIKCPLCNNNIEVTKHRYFCRNCELSVGKVIAGRTMSDFEIKELLTKGYTPQLKGFTFNGQEFNSHLVLNKNAYNGKRVEGKTLLFIKNMKSRKNTNELCPVCGEVIIETEKTYRCNKCEIFCYKEVSGKKIDIDMFKIFLKDKEIGPFNDLIKKDGCKFKKPAKITFENGKISYKF